MRPTIGQAADHNELTKINFVERLLKLASHPFQKYEMLTGKVMHVSANATAAGKASESIECNEQHDSRIRQTGRRVLRPTSHE